MAFYIAPPVGKIPLEEIMHLAKYRLCFLQSIVGHSSTDSSGSPWEETALVQGSDALIEMTAKDTLSHFLLRICAGFEKTFARFFVHSETVLFRTRFEHFTTPEKQKSFVWIKKQTKKVITNNKIGSMLYSFYNWLLDAVKHLAVADHKTSSEVILRVPFQYVPDLVSERVVTLSGGLALINGGSLVPAWTNVFKTYLELSLQQQSGSCLLDEVRQDSRILSMVQTLLEQFKSSSTFQQSPNVRDVQISASQVDDLQFRFPPCMQHLHKNLRLTHRLQHHSRIQYTLFLKECGLPLKEALAFWGEEYQQTPEVSTGCTEKVSCSHNWRKDSQRYLYNIRHLYGAEGAQKDYCAHTCLSLQSPIKASSEQGGCPFAVFDVKFLSRLLDHLQPQDCLDIIETSQKNGPQQACLQYYNTQLALAVQDKLTENTTRDLVLHCDKRSGKEFSRLSFEPLTEKNFMKPVDYFRTFSHLLEDLLA